MKKATNTTKYTTFFQHKTGRVIIVYVNLKIGFYDLHKKRKKPNNRQKRESVLLSLLTIPQTMNYSITFL